MTHQVEEIVCPSCDKKFLGERNLNQHKKLFMKVSLHSTVIHASSVSNKILTATKSLMQKILLIFTSTATRHFWLSVGSPISPRVQGGGGGRAKNFIHF